MAFARPDSVCHECQHPIGEDQEWIASTGPIYVFHKSCLHCARCCKKIETSNPVETEGKFLCKDCTTVFRKRLTPSLVETAGSLKKRPECTKCHKQLEKMGITTTNDERISWWCLDCCKCQGCRSFINHGEGCYELLDELFCPRCEHAYRAKKYHLQIMGCGPILK